MENYKNIIQKNFISIGVSEDLQGFISDAAQKLGKKNYKIPHLNISQRYQMPNEESIAIFKAKHPLEYAVYVYAKELSNEK
ncbi:MAG: hypothetical protein KDD49_07190 [Bacteroidetes bacterium]|nr:hypothetical protein [Bacteroidota bacterium]